MKLAVAKCDSLVFVIDTGTVNKKCQLNIIVLTPQPHFVSTFDCGIEKKDARFMFNKIKPYIDQFGKEKVTAIVTDNARNIRKIEDFLTDQYSHIINYGCAAHTLNNIMKKAAKAE